MTHLDAGQYSSVGLDDTFPPPPSPLVVRKECSGRGESNGGGGGHNGIYAVCLSVLFVTTFLKCT